MESCSDTVANQCSPSISLHAPHSEQLISNGTCMHDDGGTHNNDLNGLCMGGNATDSRARGGILCILTL